MENKELSFEECLKELEEVVAKLESKDISLDDAVKYYQKGLELSNSNDKSSQLLILTPLILVISSPT